MMVIGILKSVRKPFHLMWVLYFLLNGMAWVTIQIAWIFCITERLGIKRTIFVFLFWRIEPFTNFAIRPLKANLFRYERRRGGWVAESASLLRKFTGNCNEGSNPSLSATRKPSTKCLAFFMDATEVYFKLWTGKKPKIRQGRSGFLVARLPPLDHDHSITHW